MRKLTHLDKQILISNQRIFELEDPKRKKARFLWFKLTKLNKLAKKYDVDLYAVPKESEETYVFNYKNKKGEDASYKPLYRPTASLWTKDKNLFLFKHLREGMGPSKKLIVLIVLPYFDGGKIMRKNFYKETGPCAHLDFLVMSK